MHLPAERFVFLGVMIRLSEKKGKKKVITYLSATTNILSDFTSIVYVRKSQPADTNGIGYQQ
jgi:hypothetical protein